MRESIRVGNDMHVALDRYKEWAAVTPGRTAGGKKDGKAVSPVRVATQNDAAMAALEKMMGGVG